jgi:hypothetical protein
MYLIEIVSKTTNTANRNVWLQSFVDSVDDFSIILLFLWGGRGERGLFWKEKDSNPDPAGCSARPPAPRTATLSPCSTTTPPTPCSPCSPSERTKVATAAAATPIPTTRTNTSRSPVPPLPPPLTFTTSLAAVPVNWAPRVTAVMPQPMAQVPPGLGSSPSAIMVREKGGGLTV